MIDFRAPLPCYTDAQFVLSGGNVMMQRVREIPSLYDAVCPILIIGHGGVIRWLNKAAGLGVWTGVPLSAGRRLHPEHDDFHAAIAALCHDARSAATGVTCEQVRVSRSNYVALTAMLQGDDRATVVVTVMPPSGSTKTAARSTLSASEQTLLRRLVKGETVREASEAMCISYHTGRKYMQSIFRKTGARTQAQAVSLLYTESPIIVQKAPPVCSGAQGI